MDDLENRLTAYVDPDYGNDATAQLNDPGKPFKKLQSAIDTAYAEFVNTIGDPVHGDFQATVIALEGVYGPVTAGASPNNGPHASGDSFPIVMRDRVHVKGVGARRCILRGIRAGAPNTSGTSTVFWPLSTSATGSSQERPNQCEVLLDLSSSHIACAPWFAQYTLADDLIEVFDGFTFQSGDVQVLVTSGYDTAHVGEPKAAVSNCIFDMRSGFEVAVPTEANPSATRPVAGPTFGVLMVQGFYSVHPNHGYIDEKILILQNTFIMAQYKHPLWVNQCLDNAVAIVNVNDPQCGVQGHDVDCDRYHYGLASCGIVGNLIRTPPVKPSNVRWPQAFLGIDAQDSRGGDSAQNLHSCNFFAIALTGWSNNDFGSIATTPFPPPAQPANLPIFWYSCPGGAQFETPPVNCAGGSNPNCVGSCQVTLCAHTNNAGSCPADDHGTYFDDGQGTVTGDDPRFVGEYLWQAQLLNPPSTDYVDWRLLPESPAMGGGIEMGTNRKVFTGNGSSWDFKTVADEVNPFKWDGEGHGNRRRYGSHTDAGFDEMHCFIMAGSYANESNSHNKAGFLNRTAANALPNRFWIMPRSIGASFTLAGNDKVRVYAAPAAPPQPAWYQQPGTLSPPMNAAPSLNLPGGLNIQNITFGPPGALPRWEQVYSSLLHDKSYFPGYFSPNYKPVNWFALFSQADDECIGGPCVHEYFNTQLVVFRDLNGDKLWSNLQSEYR